MKIPTDLKPGDRLWYSKTEYAVAKDAFHTGSAYDKHGDIWARHISGRHYCYHLDGIEVAHDTPPIIRIERIASAKPNRRLAAAKDHLRRKMEVEAKVDKDSAWLRKLAKMHSGPLPSEFTKRAKARLRAIARRLEDKP